MYNDQYEKSKSLGYNYLRDRQHIFDKRTPHDKSLLSSIVENHDYKPITKFEQIKELFQNSLNELEKVISPFINDMHEVYVYKSFSDYLIHVERWESEDEFIDRKKNEELRKKEILSKDVRDLKRNIKFLQKDQIQSLVKELLKEIEKCE